MKQKLKLVIIALRLVILASLFLGAEPVVLEILATILKVAQTARIVLDATERIRNVYTSHDRTRR